MSLLGYIPLLVKYEFATLWVNIDVNIRESDLGHELMEREKEGQVRS